MNNVGFESYTKPEYFADLTERVSVAGKGDQITLMTMNFDPSAPEVEKLIDGVGLAATKGADARLIVDAMDFILGPDGRLGPLFYGRSLCNSHSSTAMRTYKSLENLRSRGGKYFVINQPAHIFSIPFAGRSHMKLALVNERIYLGGCNLDSEDLHDLMIGWNDAKTAHWLYGLTDNIAAAGNVKDALQGNDITFEVDENTTIYVDSGVKKQSLIYDEALRMIDLAKKNAFITCQYFPGGQTGLHLANAQKNGTDVRIIYNNPSKHHQPLGHNIYNLHERMRMPANFFENELPVNQQKLHAKILATENGIMVGSHNYVNIGVNLGTAEIALLMQNPLLARQITDRFNNTDA